jgi:AraC family transcriptional regulator
MKNEPVFQQKTAFKVVGVERFTSNGIPSIREAWAEFGKRSQEIKNAKLPGVYGIEDYSRDFDMNKGGFPKYYYIAGYEVDNFDHVPDGMATKEIAAANYAVFTYRGAVDGIHEFFGYIYGEWIPKSGYSMDPRLSLDFEHYSEPNMDRNDLHLEIWVPVVKE